MKVPLDPSGVSPRLRVYFQIRREQRDKGDIYPNQFPIPNSQFPIPNSQFPIPNSQFPIPHSPFKKIASDADGRSSQALPSPLLLQGVIGALEVHRCLLDKLWNW
ncbi:MAG: hypothetical protein F6K41_36360 [Symploca sp. SIO3E6]|nr:hypothetical protein [Caldora sp. SIO3E6]